MEYAYPAIFHKNEDSTYTITFPDLPGCISEGKTIANAIFMSQAALTQVQSQTATQATMSAVCAVLMITLTAQSKAVLTQGQ